jgi:hypothetical protein
MNVATLTYIDLGVALVLLGVVLFLPNWVGVIAALVGAAANGTQFMNRMFR